MKQTNYHANAEYRRGQDVISETVSLRLSLPQRHYKPYCPTIQLNIPHTHLNKNSMPKHGNTCVQFIAISLKVSSHVLGVSRVPHPGCRTDPTDPKFAVVIFISRFHVVGWPPRVIHHSGLGIAYRALCGSRLPGIRRTCPVYLNLLFQRTKFVITKNYLSYSLVSYSLIPSDTCYTTKAPIIKNLKPLEVVCPNGPCFTAIEQEGSYRSLINTAFKLQ